MNRIFFPFFRLHKTPCFSAMPSKPGISYFLRKKSREIPGQMAIFQAYKWRDLFFDRNFFQKKRGFWLKNTVIVRGLFSDRLFIKFRGIWPFSNLVMRGLFSEQYFSRKKKPYSISQCQCVNQYQMKVRTRNEYF